MSVMFEVMYRAPVDSERENRLTERMVKRGGKLDFREETEISGMCSQVCLTYEFDHWKEAESAAAALRGQGEHVEGPCEYGA